MDSEIFALLKSFSSSVGVDGAFCIGAALVLSAVVLNVVLCASIRGYGALKRLWVIIFAVGINVIHLALTLLSGEGIVVFLLLLGFSALVLCTVFAFPVKGKKITKEHRDFIKKIDGAINDVEKIVEQPVIEKTNKPQPMESEDVVLSKPCDSQEKKHDLNYAHVKNILQRLEYYQLSPVDKKQVGQLETCMRIAEQTGTDGEVRQQINDGLGALLKIMSKYGV